MINEIGSEFWNASSCRNDKKYFLSGRTALDYIIRDIKQTHTIYSVLLPSYCCHTMIEPFYRNGIKVRFYDVFFDRETGLRAEIPKAHPNEIFYYMKYFGYGNIQDINLEHIKCEWELIIQDRTHSWLSDDGDNNCDYSYASYRKWFGISGIAVAEKNAGQFVIDCGKETNKEYCKLRKNAASLKNKYMLGENIEKNAYLSIFNEAEELLERDYVGYVPESDAFESLLKVDTNIIKKKRTENARILTEGLVNNPEISLIFQETDIYDVPLFVPVIIKADRDGLKKYLIENKIYCPVHWAFSEYHKGLNERSQAIYQQELSLICDQRYNADDMNRILNVIDMYCTRR